jgi:hypothetical protein
VDEGWTSELLSDAAAVVASLVAHPDDDLAALAAQVQDWRAVVHQRARPLTDLALADALADATLALLARVAGAAPEQRRLVSIAARYFVSADDADDDLASPFGFHDDLEVFNAVARQVAPDLVLPG